MTGINISMEALREKANEISKMDVTLDAASGRKTAGKRAITTLLANSGNSEFVNSVIQTLRDNFETQEALVSTVLLLSNQVDDEFSDEIDEAVGAKLEEQAANVEVDLSDEELSEMADARKERVKEFKAMKEVLSMFGNEEVDSISDPKIRRGSSGPRGPRTLSKFQYTVNETELEESVNKLATVAKLCGGDVKVSDLKEYISNQGIDLKNPPANWKATLPNEVGILHADVLPQFEDEFTEDSDTDEENSDDE